MRLMSADAAPQKRGAEPGVSRLDALVGRYKPMLKKTLQGSKPHGRRNRNR